MVVGSTKMKYCVIECIKKDGKSNLIERGMYKGRKETLGVQTAAGAEVNTKSTTGFLYIASDVKSTKTINLDFYNILSIEVFDGSNKTYTFFMHDEGDQKMALSLIKEMHKTFEDFADKDDADFIDVEKYTDVPKDLGGTGSTMKAGSAFKSCGATGFTGAAHHNRNTDYYSGHGCGSYVAKKDPEPTFTKRKGRKPTQKALELMAAKIDKLSRGEYDVKLPKTAEDDPKEEVDPEDEEFTGYHGHGCC